MGSFGGLQTSARRSFAGIDSEFELTQKKALRQMYNQQIATRRGSSRSMKKTNTGYMRGVATQMPHSRMTDSRLRLMDAETFNADCQLHIVGDGCKVFEELKVEMVLKGVSGTNFWIADYTGALLCGTDLSLGNVTITNFNGVDLENNRATAADRTSFQVGN